jgi:hypothetical protein
MANTKVTSNVIADNAVGITQLNVSDGSDGQALVTNGAGTLSFATVGVSGISSSADATAITIDSSERVGIGASPSAPLTVSAADGTLALFTNASDADFQFKTASGVALITPSTGTLAFGTSNTQRWSIDSSGHFTGVSGSKIVQTIASGGGNFLEVTHTGNEAWSLAVQSGTGADDYLDIGINGGTRAISIHEDGKVGIGETSPSQNLDVKASTVNTGVLFYNTNTTSGASVPLFLASESGGSTTNISIENAGASNMIFRTGATSKDGFGTERMRIDSNGNLGLGDSSPANFSGYVVASFADSTGAILDFKTTGSEGVFARIQGAVNNGLFITNEQAYPIAFNTNATERMRITSNGNLQLALGNPIQATADGRAVNVSVGGSFVTILDFSTIGGTNAGTGFYLVTVVREGASVGTSITLQVGVSSSGLVIIYDTLQSNSLSAQTSNAQLQVKHLSAGSVQCHATAIPMSITGNDT